LPRRVPVRLHTLPVGQAAEQRLHRPPLLPSRPAQHLQFDRRTKRRLVVIQQRTQGHLDRQVTLPPRGLDPNGGINKHHDAVRPLRVPALHLVVGHRIIKSPLHEQASELTRLATLQKLVHRLAHRRPLFALVRGRKQFLQGGFIQFHGDFHARKPRRNPKIINRFPWFIILSRPHSLPFSHTAAAAIARPRSAPRTDSPPPTPAGPVPPSTRCQTAQTRRRRAWKSPTRCRNT